MIHIVVDWSQLAEWTRYRNISLKYDAIWLAAFISWNVIATFGSTALMHRYYG